MAKGTAGDVAKLKGAIKIQATKAAQQAEVIKEMNDRVEAATRSLADVEQHVGDERASLKSYVQKTQDGLNKEKTDLEAEIQAAKDKTIGSEIAFQSLKKKAIALEAERARNKGEIAAIAEAIAYSDKKATAALREKRECWQVISNIQADVTTCVARATYLEKEGFEVDANHLGALIKTHYKLRSFANYKIAKGKKFASKKASYF